jgi:hypothetical protein
MMTVFIVEDLNVHGFIVYVIYRHASKVILIIFFLLSLEVLVVFLLHF